jgi:hypothetical protein
MVGREDASRRVLLDKADTEPEARLHERGAAVGGLDAEDGLRAVVGVAVARDALEQ